MRAFTFSTILAAAAFARALPLYRRTTLDVAATLEAQQRDDTATRALTATTIKTSSGKCLSVDPLSGDFRENLTPTNACLNFDPRRAAGNQVLLFSCGGRADGGGAVTNSQQFAFTSAQGAQPLVPLNGAGKVCLTGSGSALDQASCDSTNPSADELFTFGGNGTPAAGANNANLGKTATSAPPAATTSAAAGNNAAAAPTATVTVTVTANAASCTA
ncbi:hypothetical protein C8T65DRAFT_686030 [Cerioporus squamosus]|nr:hypothetical protein C8T65DRAFT_686030 [Cerioporus squamosus]